MGHDNKQEWEQAQKNKFLTTGEDFKIIGNYAFTKIGDDISMVSKQRLIAAYKHGGEDAVVKLIGADLESSSDLALAATSSNWISRSAPMSFTTASSTMLISSD